MRKTLYTVIESISTSNPVNMKDLIVKVYTLIIDHVCYLVMACYCTLLPARSTYIPNTKASLLAIHLPNLALEQ